MIKAETNGRYVLYVTVTLALLIPLTSPPLCVVFRKDQHLLSSVNCWYLVLNQTRRESRDHATLNDIYTNNVIVRLAQISEDVIRLFKKVS